MGKNSVSLLFAASLLLAGCESAVAQMATSTTVVVPTRTPTATFTPEPTEVPATPTPTIPTPSYRVNESGDPEEFVNGLWQEVTPPEFPEDLRSQVILGSNGRLQVKVQLANFEVPEEGLVIGEYDGGEWYLVPFTIIRPLELIREAVTRPLGRGDYTGAFYFRQPETGLDIVSYSNSGEFLGLRLEVIGAGESRIEVLMTHRFEGGNLGDLRVVKFTPSLLHLVLGRTWNEVERFDPNYLSVEAIGQVIWLVEHDALYGGSSDFYVDFFIVTTEVTEDACRIRTADVGFEEYCLRMLGDPDRPVKSAADFSGIALEHSISPTERMLESRVDWWWDDTLLRPISGQDSVYIVGNWSNLAGSE